MRLRPSFGVDINLKDDYGDIYLGPLEISWCNQGNGEVGSCGVTWGGKWHLYMTYYESCDPFTGVQDGWPGFIDWELSVYGKETKCWSPVVTWFKLKKWSGKHLRRN
jgi:hypothetical protein